MERDFSVYRIGAEDGLKMGPLMILCLFLCGLTTYQVWAFVPALASLLAPPVALYLMMNRTRQRYGMQCTFSALWLEGICTFFFGSLLMALFCYVALRFIWPGFIAHQVDAIVSTYSTIDSAQARDIASTMDKARKSGLIPSPIDIALELVYIGVFSGSVLSMIFALIVRKVNSKPRQTPPPPPQNI